MDIYRTANQKHTNINYYCPYYWFSGSYTLHHYNTWRILYINYHAVLLSQLTLNIQLYYTTDHDKNNFVLIVNYFSKYYYPIM